MYHFWRQNPLFRPALFIIVGLLIDEYRVDKVVWMSVIILLNLASILWMKQGVWKRVHFVIPSIFIVFGALLHSQHRRSQEAIPENKNFAVELLTEAKINGGIISFEAEFLAHDSIEHSLFKSEQKIQILFKNDIRAATLLPGYVLLLNGALHLFKAPPNPSTFDYSSFMARKGIYSQTWIDSGMWTIIAEGPGLKRFAVQSRNYILHTIDAHISSKENRAILKALLTGYTQELVPEIREAYTRSGTMHMLAVSGMHIGILLLLLSQSLRWIKNSVLKNALLILLLWAFALFTGLSPSVMRAASMCSLYLFGEALEKKHSSWNSIAFALIIMLVWNSQLLFSVGFQLSFLALAGILIALPNKVPAVNFKDKCRSWFNSYLRISLAAQIATAPVAIYYFHQFPTYFLLGNLLIVPLAAPIMYGGILLIVVHAVPPLAQVCSWILENLLDLCQFLAKGISSLPYAGIEELNWDLLFVLSTYTLLTGLIFHFKIRRLSPFILGLVMMIFWAGKSIYEFRHSKRQLGIIVYTIQGKSAMDCYAGNSFMYIGDSLDLRETTFNVDPFRTNKMLRKALASQEISYGWGSYLSFDSLRILRYWGKGDLSLPPSQIPTLLILEKDANAPLASLLNSGNFCNIVLASNLDWKSRKNWQNQADSLGVLLHDVRVEGAYQKILWK